MGFFTSKAILPQESESDAKIHLQHCIFVFKKGSGKKVKAL